MLKKISLKKHQKLPKKRKKAFFLFRNFTYNNIKLNKWGPLHCFVFKFGTWGKSLATPVIEYYLNGICLWCNRFDFFFSLLKMYFLLTFTIKAFSFKTMKGLKWSGFWICLWIETDQRVFEIIVFLSKKMLFICSRQA